MSPRIRLTQLAVLPLALAAVALTGCPDTGFDAGGGADAGSGGAGPIGKLTLVQTIGISDDTEVTSLADIVVSPLGTQVYINTWAGGLLLTFDRSTADGSLTPTAVTPIYNGWGLAIPAGGTHLYATGNNNPFQLMTLDIDPVTGGPVPQDSIPADGFELTIAAGGSLLFQSQPGTNQAYIQAYRIDPVSGALSTAAQTPHGVGPAYNFVFLVDDEDKILLAERLPGTSTDCSTGCSIVKYGFDPTSGALTREVEVSADLWWPYSNLARCTGTSRVYVPQDQAGSIGYADIGGAGLPIAPGFSHPDLAHVRSLTMSADCQNVYATTAAPPPQTSGSLVVLARDAAGDLTWLQTIPTGMGTPLDALELPRYTVLSPDGKNVYLVTDNGGQGLAVFRRDTTGTGSP
jgi:DNA-binding beta-propeller fold protein YncE